MRYWLWTRTLRHPYGQNNYLGELSNTGRNVANARRVQISSRKLGFLFDLLFLKSAFYLPSTLPRKRTFLLPSRMPRRWDYAWFSTEFQGHRMERRRKCAKDAGARVIHFSAIGANPECKIPYARTKDLAERSILTTPMIIYPSPVFGRSFLVWQSKGHRDLRDLLGFCPSYLFLVEVLRFFTLFMFEDLARLVRMLSRKPDVERKLMDSMGFFNSTSSSYRELMQMVLTRTGASLHMSK